jgi:CSLREA domain-containing protein
MKTKMPLLLLACRAAASSAREARSPGETPDTIHRNGARSTGRIARCLLGVLLSVCASAALAAPVHTFTVDTIDDLDDMTPGDATCDDGSGHCSLRAAIQEANASAGDDAIVFDKAIDGMDITAEKTQLPAVTTVMTITGNGEANTIVQASTCDPTPIALVCVPADHRVLEVAGSGELVLEGLTVRYGRCADDCDTETNRGAGILNSGSLTLSHVTVASNYAQDGIGQGWGGGLYNLGSIPSIAFATFQANNADNSGGGLANFDAKVGEIVATAFSDNVSGSGGGLYNYGGIELVAFSTFSGNLAGSGGGLYADGTNGTVTRITGTTFTGNQASFAGGGLYSDSGPLGDIDRSTFDGNTCAGCQGGAISIFDHDAGSITNSTFSGNSADEGGALDVGSMSSMTGPVEHCTFSGNNALDGSDIFAANSQVVMNSLFGKSDNKHCDGTSDGGGNLDDDDSCGGGGALDPGNDYDSMLAANGGPTMTHALLPGSIAIDALGACAVDLQGIDQRGVPRSDGKCDVGAYEVNLDFIFSDNFEVGATGAVPMP